MSSCVGFRKEQLRVQLTSTRTLRISGERPLGDQKYGRFQKEFSVPSNVEATEINAQFEQGKLRVRLPKVIAQHNPKSVPQDQKLEGQEQAAPELVASKASAVDKRPVEKTTAQENVLAHADKDRQKAPKKDEEDSSSRGGKSSMIADARGKFRATEGYKLAVGGYLKKPKTLMNLVVAALLVLVVVLYVKNAMKPSGGQSKSTHSAV